MTRRAPHAASFALSLALFLGLGFLARSAEAHAVGVSRGEYGVDAEHVHAKIVLRDTDALAALPGLDNNGDGRLGPDEIAAGGAQWDRLIAAVEVAADGAACTGRFARASFEPPEGVVVEANFACNERPARLTLRASFLESLPAGHRHLATIRDGDRSFDTLLVLARPDLALDLGAGPPATSYGLGSLVRAGVEHILTGWDHLAFLFALLIGGVRAASTEKEGRRPLAVSSLFTMLTAFTLGHSASLAIATLGGWAPGARFVEPAVALSVAYVGVENLFARSSGRRWALTLPFGFVHGFAFAGGLLPLGIPRARLPLALLGFNVGVELGQVMVLAVLLPFLLASRSRGWYPAFTRVASVGIILAGLVWFFQRTA